MLLQVKFQALEEIVLYFLMGPNCEFDTDYNLILAQS